MQVSTPQQAGSSYMCLPAREVLRMARNSIIETNAIRAEMKRKTIIHATAKKKGFRAFLQGVITPRAHAIARAQAMFIADNFGWGDVLVCTTLEKMAEQLINDPSIPEDQKTMQISSADYNSLV